MMIIPPDELAMYIGVDDEGNLIHDPRMPEELNEMFGRFVSEIKSSNKNKKAIRRVSDEHNI